MATSQMSDVIQLLRRSVLRPDGAALTDGQLLEEYTSGRNEAALATLVGRHGPMVWGVCRRVLCSYHDAEDAFQATFLVLVRKGPSIASKASVGNWLYGVAHQTAMKARATTAKRGTRERQVTAMPEPVIVEKDLWYDLVPLLDEELSRLPDNYRAVIVLCDLEGKTRKDTARQLGCPEGTVAGRLARARMMLAKRLTQRGVTLSGGLLAAVLSQKVASAGVPTFVTSSTIKAAGLFTAGTVTTGAISVNVATLTEGVLKAMLLMKLKTVTVLLLVVAALSGGTALIYHTQAGEPQKTVPSVETQEKHDVAPPKAMEERAIQGTWTLVSTESDDETNVNSKKGNVELVVTNTLWIWKEGGEDKVDAYSIDPTQSPKRIDITWRENKEIELPTGEKRRVSIPHVRSGIYEITGDTLKLCESDTQRPTTFSTKGRSFVRLQIYKRSGAPATAAEGGQNEPKKDASKHKPQDQEEANLIPRTDKEIPLPPKAADQREYIITSRLLEAAGDQPKEVLRLPRLTLDDRQILPFPLSITDGPQNLLEKVVVDEKIKIGTFFDVRVRTLGGNRVRLIVSFQRNEVEKSSVSEIQVLGNSVQAIQDVELHKPVKIALQKESRGSAQRWLEITVEEQTIRAPAVDVPQQNQGKKDAMFPDGLSHDFGKVKPDTKVKYMFRIVNTSDAPLELTSVRVSAACVTGTLNKKVLQPTEEGKLEVTVDTRRFKGAKTIRVFLDSDHRDEIGTVIFTVTANSESADFDY